MPIKSFVCIFKITGSEIALVARNTIFVKNAHSMICYDPKFGTVVNKATPQINFDDKNLHISHDSLCVFTIDPYTKRVLIFRYDCIRDKWSQVQNY